MMGPISLKTPYEMLNGRQSKFDARSDEAIFLGYASNSNAYRVYNKHTMCVEESVHIMFGETNSLQEHSHDNDFKIGLIHSD